MLERLDFSEVDVLIVDDNVFIRRLLKEVLVSMGCRRVREADGAFEALECVRRRPPDLVFCDWMMSPVDGLALLKKLRAERFMSGVPIIMVSGHSTQEQVAMALGEGADSYIVKPFRPSTLIDHILKVVHTKDATYV